MVGSFGQIDYRLRPAKHSERSMLIDLFKRMRFAPIESYQYVGFGSVAFVDFKLVHRALGISDLISIEDVDAAEDRDRFERNKPYDGVDLHFGNASDVLPTLNFKRRSLVWLDYDNALRRSMANDLATVVRDIPSGSFVGVTVAASFPTERRKAETALTFLKENFSEFVPDDTKIGAFSGKAYAEFARSTLGTLLNRALSNADAGIPDRSLRRSAKQVCYFRYRDGTIEMATIGWIIVSAAENAVYTACGFDALSFVRLGSEPFRIRVPLVTPMEIREMERRLPNLTTARDLDWIPATERQAFASAYRYLPSFASIEAI